MLAFEPAFVVRLQSAATLCMIYKAVLALEKSSRKVVYCAKWMLLWRSGFVIARLGVRVGCGVEADWILRC